MAKIPKFDPPMGKRRAVVGLYQPRKGGPVERYHGHSKEGIYDQAHRVHSRIDVKKFKFKLGKHKD